MNVSSLEAGTLFCTLLSHNIVGVQKYLLEKMNECHQTHSLVIMTLGKTVFLSGPQFPYQENAWDWIQWPSSSNMLDFYVLRSSMLNST